MTKEDLINAALALDPKSRARLIHRLIESLDERDERLSAPEWDAAWEFEAERRLAAMREGGVKGIPGDQVFAGSRARIVARLLEKELLRRESELEKACQAANADSVLSEEVAGWQSFDDTAPARGERRSQ